MMQRSNTADKEARTASGLSTRPPFASLRPGLLQRKSQHSEGGIGATATVPAIVHDVLQSSGQPLDAGTRAFMEPRFRHDFSQVRIHTDAKAEQSARAVDAAAYAVGHNVVFGAGLFQPRHREGQRLLAHELSHVVQQSNGEKATSPLAIASPHDQAEEEASNVAQRLFDRPPIDSLSSRDVRLARLPTKPINPVNSPDKLGDPTSLPPEEDRSAEIKRLTVSVVKEPLLKALRKNDAITFLNHLRTLGAGDRRDLEADRGFIEEISRILHGSSRWIVLMILRFGPNQPAYIRQFQLAVFERHHQRIRDLLRSESRLREPIIVPGVREMLESEFRNTSELPTLLRIFSEQETAEKSEKVTIDEVHYEQDKQTGAWGLENRGSSSSFKLIRAGSELRVVLRISFVKDNPAKEPYYPTDELSARWRDGIEATWNNHFSAFNSTTRLQIVFVPVFNDRGNPPDQIVTVMPGSGRASQRKWQEEGSGRTAAHEFGHMIGNPDEYRLPQKIKDVPAKFNLSEANKRRTTIEGIGEKPIKDKSGKPGSTLPGIMGEGKEAQRRHVWPLLNTFNATMRNAGEAPFNLENR